MAKGDKSPQPKKKTSSRSSKQEEESATKWWYVAVALAVVAAISLYVVYGGGGGGAAAFTMLVHFYVTMDDGSTSEDAAGPGNVSVWGTIFNNGTAGGTPWVEIVIETGYGNQSFGVTGTPCPAGGNVEFEWQHHFDHLVASKVRVWNEIKTKT